MRAPSYWSGAAPINGSSRLGRGSRNNDLRLPLGWPDALSSERVDATPALTRILVKKDMSYLRYSISIVCTGWSVLLSSMRQSGISDMACLKRATCGCKCAGGTSCRAISTRMLAARRFVPAARKDSSTNSFISMRTSGHGPENASTYWLISVHGMELSFNARATDPLHDSKRELCAGVR